MLDLSETQEIVSKKPGTFLCWSGVYFDREHRFIRLDKVFLNLMFRDGHNVCYRRVVGVLNKEAYEPRLQYDLSMRFRVLDGPRRGHVYSMGELSPEEDFRPSGLSKTVEVGSEPWQFNDRRPRDMEVVSLFDSLPIYRETSDVVPRVYLTQQKSGSLYLRKTQDTLQYLYGFEGYDQNQSPEQNLSRLRPYLAVDAGSNREAFSFDRFYGRGVLGVEAGGEIPFGTWCYTEEPVITRGSILIDLQRAGFTKPKQPELTEGFEHAGPNPLNHLRNHGKFGRPQ